jgi:hypothetical protein
MYSAMSGVEMSLIVVGQQTDQTRRFNIEVISTLETEQINETQICGEPGCHLFLACSTWTPMSYSWIERQIAMFVNLSLGMPLFIS